ncbi:MAG: barstar family protein [Oscillospiraceae bacterium]|nr:barstar family protein [Oscillospiraceae bacterium]
MILNIDGNSIKNRDDLHRAFSEALIFPDYYGNNLDALHDCLTSLFEETEICISNRDMLKENLGDYAMKFEKCIEESSEENPRIKVVYLNKPEGKKGRGEFLRFIKFALFSASAGLIEIGVFTLLNELAHLQYWVSYLVALVCSVVWNFTLNRRFTFRSANNVPKAMTLVALFYLVFTPLSTWLEHFLTGMQWNEYLVTAINMILNFVTEFLYDRFVVFRDSIDTNDIAKKSK